MPIARPVLCILVGVTLAAPACRKDRDRSVDCQRVVTRMKELERTKSEFSKPDESPKVAKIVNGALDQRGKLLLESCTNDRWPTTMIECITAAASFTDTEQCASALLSAMTPEQSRALTTAFEAIEASAKASLQQLVDAELADIKAVRDRMCACTDDACRAKVAETKLVPPTDTLLKPSYAQIEIELTACKTGVAPPATP